MPTRWRWACPCQAGTSPLAFSKGPGAPSSRRDGERPLPPRSALAGAGRAASASGRGAGEDRPGDQRFLLQRLPRLPRPHAAHPAVVQVGQTTGVDTVYMETWTEGLPSGLAEVSHAMKVFR